MDQVGSVWTRTAQVDVVGINTMEKMLILGECKWGAQPMGRSVLADLVAKTGEIVPTQGQWRVYYVGFAREGWSEQALVYAQAMAAGATGRNWRVVGMQLLDLQEVDRDLAAWTVV